MTENVGKLLIKAEDVIYLFTAVLLVVAALLLLTITGYEFFSNLGVNFSNLDGNFSKELSRLLDSLLLVMMIVEILHTVGIMIKEHKLAIEPFLAIGIIAAVRRMLIIKAEQVHPTPEHGEVFKMTMLELGILAGMILVLVLCIFLLRRHGRDSAVKVEN